MDEIVKGIVNAETEAGNMPAEQAEEGSSETVKEEQPDQLEAEPQERRFEPLQTVFAYFCWLAGYLFCRVFPVVSSPLGGFLFVVALFLVTAIVLKKQGAIIGKISVMAAVSALVMSLGLVLSSNEMVNTVSYAFALCVYVYFIYSATDNTLQKGFSDLIIADFFKALIVLPFYNIGYMFKAIFHGKASVGGRLFGKALLGLMLALVPTFIVTVLLSYDDGFLKILDGIFSLNFADVFSHLFSIGLGIPIGMYLFGLFLSSSDRDCAETFNAENVNKLSQELKRMPQITALAASMPLLLVYVVFFVSQWKYYVSGFSGQLPNTLNYADYAREGFFQLCTVSVINLIVIIVLSAFVQHSENGKPLVLKVLSVLFSVFTLVLISTAIAKMIMYIDRFGLTHKRVYASWFMILLAVIFILVIIKQFLKGFKVVIASVGACVLLFGVLSLSNIDGFIAKYNVDRYLDGSLKTVDVGALDELGYAGIPEMIRLAKELDDELGTDISDSVKNGVTIKIENSKQYIYQELVKCLSVSGGRLSALDDGIFSFNLQRHRAEKAFESIDICN